MNAEDLVDILFSWCDDNGVRDYSQSCDTLKCGDPKREVKKVAVAMTASVNLIREAHRWGADLLIVHEPTFYDHVERKIENDPVTKAKAELLEQSGMTVWRFHDHPHNKRKDMIGEGMVRSLCLKGRWVNRQWAVNRLILDEPMAPRELAGRLKGIGAEHVRVCGSLDAPCRVISLCLGTPGGTFEELRDPEVEILLSGESCEWMLGEYARDAGQLGMKKTLMIIGHVPSEKEGMRFLTDLMRERLPRIETKYFECGEICAGI